MGWTVVCSVARDCVSTAASWEMAPADTHKARGRRLADASDEALRMHLESDTASLLRRRRINRVARCIRPPRACTERVKRCGAPVLRYTREVQCIVYSALSFGEPYSRQVKCECMVDSERNARCSMHRPRESERRVVDACPLRHRIHSTFGLETVGSGSRLRDAASAGRRIPVGRLLCTYETPCRGVRNTPRSICLSTEAADLPCQLGQRLPLTKAGRGGRRESER